MSIEAFRYDGKRAVVTGGSSGMGDATVRLLMQLGAEVHVLDLKAPTHSVATYVATDMRDPSAIDHAVAAIGAPIDALFNCAGMPQTFPPMDVMLCNFCGTRQLIEQVVPLMPEGSSIVSIASIAGMSWPQHLALLTELVATANFSEAEAWCASHTDETQDAYRFSKMALIVYSKRIAGYLMRRGIRINTLSPGSTETPMMPAFIEVAGQAAIDSVKSVAGRSSQPIEQAYPMIFLNSAAASYVNGTDLIVDGGFAAASQTGSLPDAGKS